MKRSLYPPAIAAAILFPLFFSPGSPVVHQAILACAYAIMALGLNVVVGFAGLLDLGYVAFFAVGAHVAAHFGSAFWANAHFSLWVADGDRNGIHLNFILIAVLAIAVAALVGALIGVPTLRLRGDYIAIVTLAFGEIIGQLVSNGGRIHFLGGALTGGPNGIPVVDKVDLPLLAPFRALDLRPWWWFAVALLGLVIFVNFRLRNSRPGRAWLAMRDDEQAAEVAGIPLTQTKLLAYAVGAGLGGLSGAFLASYNSFVDPTQFTFSFSIFILAMVVLGGLGSIWGVVTGAVILSVFNFAILPHFIWLSGVASGLYGLLLVLLMLLRPTGLLPANMFAYATTRDRHPRDPARAASPPAPGAASGG
jgi:branched-chain amino acid transport system permease protein